jgi:predicted alpha/beta superfamily hydrolase
MTAVLEGIDSFTLASSNVGDILEVTVAVSPWASETSPVIYTLDPLTTFLTTTEVSRGMTVFSMGQIPPSVIVGVGYATTDVMEIVNKRGRDLTPTEAILPPEIAMFAGAEHGGAAQFLAALVQEVMPAVAGRGYAMNTSDSALVGHSYAGLFGAYVLFVAPETFGRYLLSSPSLWWDDGLMLKMETEFAAGHDDLAARVFLSAGEYEDGPADKQWPPGPRPEGTLTVAPTTQLYESLVARNYPNLDVSHAVLSGEDHATAFPAALTRGLRTLFP